MKNDAASLIELIVYVDRAAIADVADSVKRHQFAIDIATDVLTQHVDRKHIERFTFNETDYDDDCVRVTFTAYPSPP